MHITYIIYGLVLINILTFTLYALDKRAARRGGWRVKESTLLFLSLLGGSPAALIASKVLHHKTIKRDFILRFWLVIIIQVTAVVFFFLFYN